MMRAGRAPLTVPKSWPPLEPMQGSPNPVLPLQPTFTPPLEWLPSARAFPEATVPPPKKLKKP